MKYIVFGNILVYLMDMVSNGTFSGMLAFLPAAVLRGEVWRLVTFIIVPDSSGNLFFHRALPVLLLFYRNRHGTEWAPPNSPCSTCAAWC